MITLADLDALEQKYQLAKGALDKITAQNYYPVYPAEIKEFMGRLGQPPWGQTNYAAMDYSSVLHNIAAANLTEICCVLTAVCRAERFCDGAWQGVLRRAELDPVFQRLRQIIAS